MERTPKILSTLPMFIIVGTFILFWHLSFFPAGDTWQTEFILAIAFVTMGIHHAQAQIVSSEKDASERESQTDQPIDLPSLAEKSLTSAESQANKLRNQIAQAKKQAETSAAQAAETVIQCQSVGFHSKNTRSGLKQITGSIEELSHCMEALRDQAASLQSTRGIMGFVDQLLDHSHQREAVANSLTAAHREAVESLDRQLNLQENLAKSHLDTLSQLVHLDPIQTALNDLRIDLHMHALNLAIITDSLPQEVRENSPRWEALCTSTRTICDQIDKISAKSKEFIPAIKGFATQSLETNNQCNDQLKTLKSRMDLELESAQDELSPDKIPTPVELVASIHSELGTIERRQNNTLSPLPTMWEQVEQIKSWIRRQKLSLNTLDEEINKIVSTSDRLNGHLHARALDLHRINEKSLQHVEFMESMKNHSASQQGAERMVLKKQNPGRPIVKRKIQTPRVDVQLFEQTLRDTVDRELEKFQPPRVETHGIIAATKIPEPTFTPFEEAPTPGPEVLPPKVEGA